jgi:hypothetical protein
MIGHISRDVKGDTSHRVLFCPGLCYNPPQPGAKEQALSNLMRHLPFVLVAFLVLLIGIVDLGVHVEFSAFVTLLAPIFWLGLYVLFGAARPASRE